MTDKARKSKYPLTKLEKAWIGYDIGNSAFTLLVSTIFPIYFNSLAEGGGLAPHMALAYWGYATAITTLIVAILGPIFGAMADVRGKKKKLFAMTVAVGVLTMMALMLPLSWFQFLVFFIIARVGYQASLVLYDAMLTDITEPERMSRVSSYGYALGYIGSTVPFILSLILILMGEKIGLSMQFRMGGAIIINAIWWLAFTIPLYKNFEQKYYASETMGSLGQIFRGLGKTILDLRHFKKAFLFLIAFFFYIDGVYTIIDMAVAYGGSLGLDSTQLLLALLLTQFVAFPFALLFGKLSNKYDNGLLIKVCIVAYALITLFAVQLDKVWEFWFLAVCVGMFQGGVQALSRSYFAQSIPKEKSGEYFGIYDIFGKGASITGTLMVSAISQATGRQNLGILALVILFIFGFYFFAKADKVDREVIV